MKEECEVFKKVDCNEKFKKELFLVGIIDDVWLVEIEVEYKDIINKVIKVVEDVLYLSVEEVYVFVYEEGSFN